jgi:hypothetical protein
MNDHCKFVVLNFAILFGIAAMPSHAHAQWWSSRTPVDYEDCVEKGEKAADSKDAKAAVASQCDVKFAGRRKPGGGYTYFDFMQNRSFDIAGPNPTPAELRKMDEQYTEFLDQRRKTIIAAAFAEKQKQQAQLASLQPAQQLAPPRKPAKPALVVDKPHTETAMPRAGSSEKRAGNKPQARKPHYACNNDPLSCGWDHLSAGISAMKKSLFGKPAKSSKGS